ncbi:MAG: hypothetical protein K0B05_09500 [Bacteroidales bacterium]|nr:hypothetical protein [Bacteroidales bacterium]
MKRIILISAAFIFLSWAFSSCEAIRTCKLCRQVTYDGTSVIGEGQEREYCNADLFAIENMTDVIVGTTRVTWECR